MHKPSKKPHPSALRRHYIEIQRGLVQSCITLLVLMQYFALFRLFVYVFSTALQGDQPLRRSHSYVYVIVASGQTLQQEKLHLPRQMLTYYYIKNNWLVRTVTLHGEPLKACQGNASFDIPSITCLQSGWPFLSLAQPKPGCRVHPLFV